MNARSGFVTDAHWVLSWASSSARVLVSFDALGEFLDTAMAECAEHFKPNRWTNARPSRFGTPARDAASSAESLSLCISTAQSDVSAREDWGRRRIADFDTNVEEALDLFGRMSVVE